MERNKAHEYDKCLPHEGMSLENKCEISPQVFDTGVGIQCRYDLGLSAYVKGFIPNTGLTVWE